MASTVSSEGTGSQEIARNEIKFQDRLIRLLREFSDDKDKYHRRVESHLKSAGRNIWMPKNGYLKPMQLVTLLGAEGGGFDIQRDFSDLLRRLNEWGISSDHGGLDEHGPQIILNDKAIKIYDRTGVLENAVWGLDFVFAKCAKATPAIIVERNGSEHIGTGSIVRLGPPTDHKFFLVTNGHVVDPKSGITVKRIEIHNHALTQFIGDWRLCSTDDLAAIEIAWTPDQPYFCIDFEVRLLEKVTTLGYPKIPFADDAYLAFHSGEVNTVFRTRDKEEMFLISNQVGPGSSGGPVINNKGYLVGVTAKAFQGKMEPDAEYLINWNAAVTFKRVRAFLESVSGLDDWTTGARDWIQN